MTDGLKPSHREAIIEKLAANPRVDRIVLFDRHGNFHDHFRCGYCPVGNDSTRNDRRLVDAMAESPTHSGLTFSFTIDRKPSPA